MAAGQLFARDAELAVGLAADREDDRVVEPLEVLDLEVMADLDVAEEAEALAGRGFFVDPDHRLDLRVVGGDAAADEPEGGGEAIEEVDLGVGLGVFEDVLGGVEAGRAGADDGDADGVLFGSDLGHLAIPCLEVGMERAGKDREEVASTGSNLARPGSGVPPCGSIARFTIEA